QQNQPGPQQLRRYPSSLQCQPTQYHPQETTAGIAHKDTGRRKVPDQEPSYRRSQQQRRRSQHRNPDQRIQQSSTHTNGNGLHTGDPINTVHEVVQIQQPHQHQGTQQVADQAQI